MGDRNFGPQRRFSDRVPEIWTLLLKLGPAHPILLTKNISSSKWGCLGIGTKYHGLYCYIDFNAILTYKHAQSWRVVMRHIWPVKYEG